MAAEEDPGIRLVEERFRAQGVSVATGCGSQSPRPPSETVHRCSGRGPFDQFDSSGAFGDHLLGADGRPCHGFAGPNIPAIIRTYP